MKYIINVLAFFSPDLYCSVHLRKMCLFLSEYQVVSLCLFGFISFSLVLLQSVLGFHEILSIMLRKYSFCFVLYYI